MFEYNEKTNDMKLTRGDSAYFDIDLKDENDTEYTMQSGDLLTFTIKNSAYTKVPVVSLTSSTPTFRISPSDTKHLRYGEYAYDIQLSTGNDIFTVVGPAVFEITEEITW